MFGLEKIWDTAMGVLIAAAGGLARQLSVKDKSNLRFGYIVAEIFVAAFCGAIVLMLVSESNVSENWVGIACGIAGWTSPLLLHALTRVTEKLLKLNVGDLKKGNRRKG